MFLPHFQILVMLWFKNPVLIATHLSLVLSQIQLHCSFCHSKFSSSKIPTTPESSISVSPTNRNNCSFSNPSVIKSNYSKPVCAPCQASHFSPFHIECSKCSAFFSLLLRKFRNRRNNILAQSLDVSIEKQFCFEYE